MLSVTKNDVVYDGEPIYIDYNYNGKDYLIINGGESGFFIFDGEFVQSHDNPNVTGAAIYDGKLFACSAENYPRVKYMAPSAPGSWSSNYSSLTVYNECGLPKSLATLKNYIYVFQSNGISRITRAESDNYSVAKIWQTGEEIFGETVKVIGGEIWFFTSNGLYRFDGSLPKKTHFVPRECFVGGRQSRIEQFGDKIYVSTILNCDDEQAGERNNAIIVIGDDCARWAVYSGESVRGFFKVANNALIAAFYDGSMAVIESPPKGADVVGNVSYAIKTQLKKSGLKRVSSIKLAVTGEGQARLVADGAESVYSLKASAGAQVVRCNAVGDKIALTVCVSGGKLSAPVIYFSEVN